MNIPNARPQDMASLLPEELPVFPLAGAVLLPGARLPLNIFEPRYLAMVEDAMGKGRMIGMMQPNVPDHAGKIDGLPPLYSVGCVGRITSFNETEDGRFLIVLTGICRFRLIEELPASRLYRLVRADWKPYLNDLSSVDADGLDRDRLLEVLQAYFKKCGIAVDWNVVKNAPDHVLVSTAIMICPFATNEKQALLEADDYAARVQMLFALLEMATMQQGEIDADSRH